MKFIYIGDPNYSGSEPEEITVFGHHFVRNGDPVEVSGKAEGKLANNSHFKHAPDHQEPEMPKEKPKKLSAPKKSTWVKHSS